MTCISASGVVDISESVPVVSAKNATGYCGRWYIHIKIQQLCVNGSFPDTYSRKIGSSWRIGNPNSNNRNYKCMKGLEDRYIYSGSCPSPSKMLTTTDRKSSHDNISLGRGNILGVVETPYPERMEKQGVLDLKTKRNMNRHVEFSVRVGVCWFFSYLFLPSPFKPICIINLCLFPGNCEVVEGQIGRAVRSAMARAHRQRPILRLLLL